MSTPEAKIITMKGTMGDGIIIPMEAIRDGMITTKVRAGTTVTVSKERITMDMEEDKTVTNMVDEMIKAAMKNQGDESITLTISEMVDLTANIAKCLIAAMLQAMRGENPETRAAIIAMVKMAKVEKATANPTAAPTAKDNGE